VVAAIVILGPAIQQNIGDGDPVARASTTVAAMPLLQQTRLVCVEVLGRSVVRRVAEELRQNGVEMISVVADASLPVHAGLDPFCDLPVCWTENAWSEAIQKLMTYKENGVEAILLVRVGAYIEFDIADALQFHREHGSAVTRAFAEHNPLEFWIIDPAGVADSDGMLNALTAAYSGRYRVRGYVNRLEHPGDLRRLAVDGLSNRCRLTPVCSETRAGIWIEEGAQVHRDARIVAPAYIGRNARIAEQCLITRCSNVESNCQIDYGTVVEDSSILSNTYVGIGLDLSHSIADGSKLLNLQRGVTLEIADPCVLRQNGMPNRERHRQPPGILGLGGAQLTPAREDMR